MASPFYWPVLVPCALTGSGAGELGVRLQKFLPCLQTPPQQMLGDLAFTPFSAGLVGGVLVGAFASPGRSYRLSPHIAFALWLAISAFTVKGALASPGNLLSALSIAVLWGGIPFSLCFLGARAIAGYLRRLLA